MSDNENKYGIDSLGHTYGRSFKGGWDIDTSERTQRTSDAGHIPGREQFEESVDVSKDLFDNDDNDNNSNDNDNNDNNNDDN